MSKVLIIEDSPTQSLALQEMLEQAGLRVWSAFDGQEGLKAAHKWSPDVIVLDLRLPKMDGFEVCRSLQADEMTSHIPVIMLTAHDSQLARSLSINLGAVDFIPKDSCTNATLLETLRQLHILTEPSAGKETRSHLPQRPDSGGTR